MTTAMPANKFDEMFHRFHCGGVLDRGDQMALLNEANRARDQAAILEDELKKIHGAVESASAIQLRQHDGRALRLACNMLGDALHEDCGMSVWTDYAFKELGLSHMALYDQDPGDRSVALVASFREVARKESEVSLVDASACCNCGNSLCCAQKHVETKGHAPWCKRELATECKVCGVSARKKETMSEEEKKFEAGEIVRLKSGGPMMTVGENAGDRVHCFWCDGHAEDGFFPAATLRRVNADEIEAERSVLFAEADKVKADAKRLDDLFSNLQSNVIPTAIPLFAEYIRDRSAAERAKNQPAQLFNAFRDAFLALNDEQRDLLISNVMSRDPEAGKKFFEAMMATG